MDSRKSIEDQFSKLHPSLPVSTRIGIVGGGPSGLSAAYALAKLGYSNVNLWVDVGVRDEVSQNLIISEYVH